MPPFLSDPPPHLLVVLTCLVLVMLAIWFNRWDRVTLVVFLAALVLTGLVVLLDRLFESPREQAVRAVRTLVEAADTGNPELFASQLADSFQYQGEGSPVTVTREQVRRSGFWDVLKRYRVHVAAWDFARSDAEQLDPDTVEIGFLAKGEADGQQYPVYLRARFARQPDGKMRLVWCASFDALKRQNEPKSIPYFP